MASRAKPPTIPLEELRAMYEAGAMPVPAVAFRADISVPRLYTLIRRHGWKRRRVDTSASASHHGSGPEARRRLVARIWAAADAQLREIEARMHKNGELGEGGGVDERDARITATLVKTVRELVALDEGMAAAAKTKDEAHVAAVTPDALRDELVRRLEARLREG